jgi:hypothetical protein
MSLLTIGDQFPAHRLTAMIAKLVLGAAIAATAISTAAPAAADPDNPFSHLCMDGQCSTRAPATVRHADPSQVWAGIQQGLHAMQSRP